MEAVINAALPVFALILAGYLAARFQILGPAATDSINRFVVYLALPALLFQAMATIAGRQLANLHFLLAFGGGMLITFGLSIIIQNGLMQAFSADSQRLQAGAIETASVSLGGGITIGLMPLATFGSAVVVILGLNFLFYRTALGRAFRATSDDLEIAELMGIDHRRIFSLAMGVAMIVATIAALYLGMRANFDPTIGPARLLYAFEAVIVGGLGSFWGTLAGGVIIGLAQTIGAELNPEWQILAGHLAFLFVLVLRPRGLFPRALD